MKCINKCLSVILSAIAVFCLTACGSKDTLPCGYERNNLSSSLAISTAKSLYVYSEPFAKELCVDDKNYLKSVDLQSAYAAGLFDINDNTVLYGKNMYEEMTPASITKLLTTLVVLKYCDLNKEIIFTPQCKITEAGAQLMGLNEGDKLTTEQALNILLLYSANDVAMMLANNYEGGYDAFISKMNEEAMALGATHTHFVNPHGLTEDTHHTTVYDLYLILNELIKYDKFREIVCQKGYATSYTKADGTIKTIEISNTNQFIKGDCEVPTGYTVLGGKTGTTEAAGKCLIIYFEDSEGNPYIACILRAEDYELLYSDMTKLIMNAQ